VSLRDVPAAPAIVSSAARLLPFRRFGSGPVFAMHVGSAGLESMDFDCKTGNAQRNASVHPSLLQ
jgi:hypothetical protein